MEHNGWISLHRRIKESSIFMKSPEWLKIWIGGLKEINQVQKIILVKLWREMNKEELDIREVCNLSDFDIIKMVVKILESKHWRCKMRKYKKEELNIEDKIKDVLDEFDLTEGENFRYALDTIIGEVSDDEFSDLDIIEMVVEILESKH